MDATGADGYRRWVGLICCIGIARTGSSQLVRSMESFDGVVSIHTSRRGSRSNR